MPITMLNLEHVDVLFISVLKYIVNSETTPRFPQKFRLYVFNLKQRQWTIDIISIQKRTNVVISNNRSSFNVKCKYMDGVDLDINKSKYTRIRSIL